MNKMKLTLTLAIAMTAAPALAATATSIYEQAEIDQRKLGRMHHTVD